MTNYQLSTEGYQFIKQWEGERLQAYRDPAGVWTIGVGHTGPVNGQPIKAGLTITAKQSEQLLQTDIHTHTQVLKQVVTAPLTQHQFDALASFCFNLGPNIIKDAALLQAINRQDWLETTNQMSRYVHAGNVVLQGLVNRRQAEIQLFMKNLTTSNWRKETGTFTLNTAINLRTQANTNASIIATLQPKQAIKYDAYLIEANGHVWLRQPRDNGYGYLASGQSKNNKRISYWGSFS
ncbi:glycoside hydrolase family protein [Vagococcus xieshaowenii]|uniref:Lysozyme n=1 Tax=Vagococcus xieshaowenii TaxID=2562451 RepID=A0AAJ5EH49_9ENTE|nr:glycoside hydrolase family protein [Vagococcus xieshaowenii]QCA29250.1 hypothetical protein E4Z98_07930 [Vagococcus xieshaowenii]TFZ43238.1 hypothetical protein E4031_00515 [Vagococcus xieshaowenii]